jgi:hypothetical protein
MRLAQDDHMVEAFAPDRSDQSLGITVLPRRPWCNGLQLNAKRLMRLTAQLPADWSAQRALLGFR